jgi:hypothetical protein
VSEAEALSSEIDAAHRRSHGSGVEGPRIQATPSPRNLDGLTAVRFYAALWVFLFHFSLRIPLHLQKYLARIVENGALAMPVFFLLSGLVLGYRYRDKYRAVLGILPCAGGSDLPRLHPRRDPLSALPDGGLVNPGLSGPGRSAPLAGVVSERLALVASRGYVVNIGGVLPVCLVPAPAWDQ